MPNFYADEIQKTVDKLNRLIKLAAIKNMAIELSVYSKQFDAIECGLLECNLQGISKNNDTNKKNNLLLHHGQ